MAAVTGGHREGVTDAPDRAADGASGDDAVTGDGLTEDAGTADDGAPPVDRAALEARYRALVRERLPAAAREHRWVLRDDHCFGRVLLDDAVGACWYDVLDRRRTAFLQLSDAQLTGAVALAERLLVEGDPLLRELDARSLAWRGKPPKRERPVSRAARRG